MVRRLVWDQDFAGSIPVTPTKKAKSFGFAFFDGVGIEPVYLLCKYGSSFLKYSQNVRSAQLHFIFPYFSYILVKTVINRFHCGDLSLRPNNNRNYDTKRYRKSGAHFLSKSLDL